MVDDKKFIKLAKDLAAESVTRGGFPAGSVIVKDGKVISKGLSLGIKTNDPTLHCEIDAIKQACSTLNTMDLRDCTLYTSMEPCSMCFGAVNWAKIPKIVFGCKRTEDMVSKNFYEGKIAISEMNQQNNKKVDLIYMPDYEEEILKIIRDWEIFIHTNN